MNKKKILLVEDDEVLASVYRARLEMEGFEVEEVHDGEKALSVAINFRPDLILLDVMLPNLRIQTLYHLPQRYLASETPSVVLKFYINLLSRPTVFFHLFWG